jgi:hypothetical protein
MQQHADEYDKDAPINHIILVGHNVNVFDIPFLLIKCVSIELQIGSSKIAGLVTELTH